PQKMSVRKSGSRAVSLKSSAFPDAIRPAQCWSLGCQSATLSGRLKARTCWRRTSGWKSGLDSRAIGIYDLRLAIYELGANYSQFFLTAHGVVLQERVGG